MARFVGPVGLPHVQILSPTRNALRAAIALLLFFELGFPIICRSIPARSAPAKQKWVVFKLNEHTPAWHWILERLPSESPLNES
jgi:hypothetical protein